MTNEELIEHVKLAINPHFQNWILFENGTYIIIEDATGLDEINEQGIKKMKEFGPVQAGTPAGDFETITLNATKGWVVSGHGYGMYTYVHPSELADESPENYVVGLLGRSKRDLDGGEPVVVCLCVQGNITKY